MFTKPYVFTPDFFPIAPFFSEKKQEVTNKIGVALH